MLALRRWTLLRWRLRRPLLLLGRSSSACRLRRRAVRLHLRLRLRWLCCCWRDVRRRMLRLRRHGR